MLRHMFKWINDFEKTRNFHENRLMYYKRKLIWIKSVNQLKEKI